MSEFKLVVPVVLCVFKRLDTTQRVFEKIREAKPPRLYIVADCARENVAGEKEKAEAVRNYIEQHIDWDCKVYKNYASTNMGCGRRISSGVSWVFETEEEAIILEDDCVPDDTFFRYCQEMLEYYKNDERIFLIGGCNPIAQLYLTEHDYLFSNVPFIWGWATWKRAWKLYDYRIPSWKNNKNNPVFKKAIPIKKAYWMYTAEFDILSSGKFDDTWSYQIMYTGIINSMYGIVPAQSHVFNIGFMEESTHTKSAPKWMNQNIKPVKFPITYRKKVEWDKEFDVCWMKHFCAHGLTIKVKHMLGLDINKSIFTMLKKKKQRK